MNSLTKKRCSVFSFFSVLISIQVCTACSTNIFFFHWIENQSIALDSVIIILYYCFWLEPICKSRRIQQILVCRRLFLLICESLADTLRFQRQHSFNLDNMYKKYIHTYIFVAVFMCRWLFDVRLTQSTLCHWMNRVWMTDNFLDFSVPL